MGAEVSLEPVLKLPLAQNDLHITEAHLRVIRSESLQLGMIDIKRDLIIIIMTHALFCSRHRNQGSPLYIISEHDSPQTHRAGIVFIIQDTDLTAQSPYRGLEELSNFHEVNYMSNYMSYLLKQNLDSRPQTLNH